MHETGAGFPPVSTLVVDIDGTLAGPPLVRGDYSTCVPNRALVTVLRKLRAAGWRVHLDTARNMRTYECNVGVINARTLPVLIAWLDAHDVPYDEIHVAKPWPSGGGFLVDDKAVRPSELLSLGVTGAQELLRQEAASMREHWAPN